MRFLLYNIRYAAGIGLDFHFPFPYSGYLKRNAGNFGQITDFIRSLNPDIAGLIEVDSGSFRAERCNQAAVIADVMRQRHVFENKYGSRSLARRLPILGHQGNALVTNRDIRNLRFHYLNNGMKRLVIEAEMDAFTLFLVHLSLKYGRRRKQLEELAGLILGAARPVVVAGDFNSFRGADELSLFMATAGLQSADRHGAPSHPSRAPRRQLDFILHGSGIRTQGFQTLPVRYSDHVPLLWDFEVSGPA